MHDEIKLDKDMLIKWIMDGVRRTIVHYGCWFREVDYQLGTLRACEIENSAGDSSWNIIINRLAKVLGFEVEDGVPVVLKQKSEEELEKLLNAVCVNWLANDGVWFQTVEKAYGMDYAKRCNDTCWTRFSPFEAIRIKKLLKLPTYPGIEGLKKALFFRLYARINKQSIEEIDEKSFIFRMNECRVQLARKRKGLPDYPCKSVGIVEYTTFAETIDPRIKTECIGCPPDEHPDDWWCAWKFTIME
ncbi:MAG: cytosolic protein [Deltaproteobacteria bacterium]|nr:cytosolic protein [Deltaproteobacteria bacterium]MBW2068503.1 cytosolic protein [Deltaproteobacteria bacterium]